MDPSRYCRDVESYLCRKNDGHLIRIVGPAFELVYDWATRQIPLSVVHRAIDGTFESYHAKGTRRRPLRIEFCEADVLGLFDEWRRAVGTGDGSRVVSEPRDARSRRRPSLAAHLDRVILALTSARAGAGCPSGLAALAGRVVEELDAVRGAARTARGAARQRLVTRLADVDRELMEAVRGEVDQAVRGTLREDAARDLEPFRGRMPPETFQRAVEASTDRLLREHFKLPRITFD